MSSTGWKRVAAPVDHAKTSIWKLPDPDEHFLNTGSPEDLFLNPEDLDVIPGVIQDGMNDWSRETDPTAAGWYPSPVDYNIILPISRNDWYVFPSDDNILILTSRNDWYASPSDNTFTSFWY